MKLIELNIAKIQELCKRYKVRTLAVFGSILTDHFNAESDVDIAITFEKDVTYLTYSDNFFGLYYGLKNIFGREVDLVDESSVKNPYFRDELNETKQLIYG